MVDVFNLSTEKVNHVAVIFHNADADGFASCAIAMKYFEKCHHINPYFIGMNYSDKLNYEKLSIVGRDAILMCDFSLPVEEMLKLKEHYGDKFIWIDHHVTAIQDSIDNHYSDIKGIRMNEKAACELTWDFLFPYQKLPRSVSYMAKHDIWDHTDIKTVYYAFGLKNFDVYPINNLGFWNKTLSDMNTDKIIEVGKIIYEYEARQAKTICRGAGVGLINFEGYRAVIVNRSNINSMFFDDVDDTKFDVMMIFSYKPMKKNWVFSIFTKKEDIDVSELAKKYGGGGHRAAAGFVVNDFSMLEKIMENTISYDKRTFVKK